MDGSLHLRHLTALSNCGMAEMESDITYLTFANRRFIATLRGHIAPVYQCSWSSDSRLLVSSSKDTTLKVWDMKTRKMKQDLPGHDDEVYAVDWSPDGQLVASGGKDKKVRLFGF